MDIRHRLQDHVLIITPMNPRLDVIQVQEFKDRVLKIIDENETDQVIFDLNHVEFVDSAGLVCFLNIWKLMNSRHGSLKFVGIHKTVRLVIEMVLLNKVFDIFSTVEEAVASFSNNSAKK